MDKEFMQYFIKNTDQKIDRIEEKIDDILKFKWRIAGGVAVLGFLVTVGIQLIFKLKGM